MFTPRENCIAPAIVLIVWTTDTKNGRGLAPDSVPLVAIPSEGQKRAGLDNTPGYEKYLV